MTMHLRRLIFLLYPLASSSNIVGADDQLGLGRIRPRANTLQVNAKIPGWLVYSCMTDSRDGRTLNQAGYIDTANMSQESCTTFCGRGGYLYAGVEYGSECYCANFFANGANATSTDCNMPCAGNSTEACGAGNRLNVFLNSTSMTSGPFHNPGPPGWRYSGCFVDSTQSRTLKNRVNTPGGTGSATVALCVQACQSLNYPYSGVEYGGECYCDTTLSQTQIATDGLAGCNMVCAGNSTEYCGGGNRLDAYSVIISTSSSSSARSSSTSSSRSSSSSSGSSSSSSSSSTRISVSTTASVKSTSTTSSGLSSISASSSSSLSALSSLTTGATSATTSTRATSSSTMITSSPVSSSSFSISSSSSLSLASATSILSSSSSSSSSSSFLSSTTSSSSAFSSLASPSTSSSSSRATISLSSSQATSSATTATPTIPSTASGTLVTSSFSSVTSMISASSMSLGSSSTTKSTVSAALVSSTTSSSDSVMTAGTLLSMTTGLNSSSAAASSSSTISSNSITTSLSSNTTSLSSIPISLNSNTTSSSSVTAYSSSIVTTSSSIATSSSSITTSSYTSPTPIPGWKLVGCVTDQVGARTFSMPRPVVGGGGNVTQENCQSACFIAGYVLAGVEYANECYCDNVYQNGGILAPDGNAQCNMACSGNANQICGGPDRLTTFKYVGGASNPPIDPVAQSPTTTAASKATPTNVSTGLPSGWAYKGCYNDNVGNGRILYQQQDTGGLTVESCIATCQSLTYTVAGMEYSTQCFCGNYTMNAATSATPDSKCAMPCGGAANEICGGGNLMSIYASQPIVGYGAPAIQKTKLPGNWTYKGCLTDSINQRALPYLYDDVNVTISSCLTQCAKFGYSAGGVEYGRQCLCGDITDPINAGQPMRADTDCAVLNCPGQPDTYCGNGDAIVYYTWPANLPKWTQGSGNSAGAYQLLIGGVVVPLITTLGVNYKVTFLEKSGNNYQPYNSTGAYELDLSQIGNFTAAWRTMRGLRTDVFCSAGLTLPDKAGRQVNIGGWSNNALYGIRVYWPDGAPGQPSVNDWQEDVNSIHLLDARWYPSAMQMVNGSILIVGGEDGANGPAMPTMEVLPTPAGVVKSTYAQWLQDTDPNNLYPFLTVLPSGNIAVFYWNQARILDEKSLDTIRILPQIPGAVDRPDGGRTYPLMGTSMLFAQSAPYTDPLTVLICGGSTPYQGGALDNCVSIQPEIAAAQWQIERMPIRRVMSSMTALPDGTFLILNGAQQGVGGFALATNPTLMAVLYDPSKPLNQRMTRMANTTVARLYHNEAILLPDGRVMVSGSDPEDAAFPQEYRVEVFTPPYLLGSLAASRPAFVFSTYTKGSSLGYGSALAIKITAGTASKISLMGAVSSTHGNSMGQRTLFPAFSCSGSTCTVTMPPNAYVTGGPGWFMLYVLNANGTPSVGQWLRIGGDPASLGNWPPGGSFTLPGV